MQGVKTERIKRNRMRHDMEGMDLDTYQRDGNEERVELEASGIQIEVVSSASSKQQT